MLGLVAVCICHLVDVSEATNGECHTTIYMASVIGCWCMYMSVDARTPPVKVRFGCVDGRLESMYQFRSTFWHAEVFADMVRTCLDLHLAELVFNLRP